MGGFGSNLRSLREARGLSRNALRDLVVARFGQRAAVSADQLANWERGDTEGMSASKLASIVEVLGADYEDVFSRLVRSDDVRDRPDAPARETPQESTAPGDAAHQDVRQLEARGRQRSKR